MLTLNDYQKQALTTCMASSYNYTYLAEGLVSEMGEFVTKVTKAIRKQKVAIENNQLVWKADIDEGLEFFEGLKGELGDVQWFVSLLAKYFGWDLEEVADKNLKKLNIRKENGTIDGNGDGVTREERL